MGKVRTFCMMCGHEVDETTKKQKRKACPYCKWNGDLLTLFMFVKDGQVHNYVPEREWGVETVERWKR